MTNIRGAVLIVEPRLAIGLDLSEHIRRLGHQVAGPFSDVAYPQKLLERATMRVSAALLNPHVEAIAGLAEALDRSRVPLIYLDDEQSLHPRLPEGLWLPRTGKGILVWLANMSVKDVCAS